MATVKKSTTKKTPRKVTMYALSPTARPVSGERLSAHTLAALNELGMLKSTRPSVPRESVTALIGARAVSYHLSSGTFDTNGDNVRLSKDGAEAMQGRKVDEDLLQAFVHVLRTGAANKALGVNKSQIEGVTLVV